MKAQEGAGAPRVALVTGATGQDGVYLCRLLRAQGLRVVGTVLPGSDSGLRVYLDGVELVDLDLRDADAVRRVIARVRPDELYNLAGFTSVGASWQQPDLARAVNADAVATMLGALLDLRADGVDTHFFQASSAEVFGPASSSPYAQAKAVAHELTVTHREEHGLYAVCGVLSNHESPLRGRAFVPRKITRAAAEIARGRADHVTLGNLAVSRDWGCAHDYVTAMPLMLRRETPADFALGTGVAHSLEDLVRTAFAAAGLEDAMSYVRTDPALFRPVDADVIVADPRRATEELGWTASVTFAETIAEMVAVDLLRVDSGVEEDASYLTRPPAASVAPVPQEAP